MKQRMTRIVFCSFAFLLFSAAITDAEYIEGVDTTDYYYGLDTSFYIDNSIGVTYINYSKCKVGMAYGPVDNISYLSCSFGEIVVIFHHFFLLKSSLSRATIGEYKHFMLKCQSDTTKSAISRRMPYGTSERTSILSPRLNAIKSRSFLAESVSSAETVVQKCRTK